MHLRRHGVKFLRLLIMMDPRKPQQPAAADSDTPAAWDALDWDGMLRTGKCMADRMRGPPHGGSRWTGVGV